MLDPQDILFIDIETVPETDAFQGLGESGKYAFAKKFGHQVEKQIYTDLEDAYRNQAPLLAEFSKVVAICGVMSIKNPTSPTTVSKEISIRHQFKFVGPDEGLILKEFAKFLSTIPGVPICAHNGKMFDFPFLCRRYIINSMDIPQSIDTFGLKPWEVEKQILDTADRWRFTDMRYMISLASLCYCLGLPDPKVTMDGGEVMKAYYDGKYIEIGEYCFSDAVSVHNIWSRYCRKPLLMP